MASGEPLFWYPEYWMHIIYSRGVEEALRTVGTLPMEYPDPDGNGMLKAGDSRYFYWKALPFFRLDQVLPEVIGIPVYRLFALKEKSSDEFFAVVELRKEQGDDCYCLHASRDFDIGDAILFISEFEEETRSVVLGGICARVSDSEDECNAYLTANRMLRCKKIIKKGDEIVRWNNEGRQIEYFENIDQVVVSPELMKVGRIGTEMIRADCKSLVHFPEVNFPESSFEIARNRHVRVYKQMKA